MVPECNDLAPIGRAVPAKLTYKIYIPEWARSPNLHCEEEPGISGEFKKLVPESEKKKPDDVILWLSQGKILLSEEVENSRALANPPAFMKITE